LARHSRRMSIPVQARILAVVQKPIAARIFDDKITRPAWELKPSWYLVSEIDRMIPAETQRFMSKRMGAKVLSVRASHCSMISHPDKVAKSSRTRQALPDKASRFY
jgi:pimeloyl-ACP methyl ester carboxylesterase